MTSGLKLSRVLQTQSVQDSPAKSRHPPVNEERLQPHLWTWPRCHRRAAQASPRLLSQSVAGGGHRPKPGIPRKRDAVGEEGLRARPLLLSLPPASLAPRSAGSGHRAPCARREDRAAGRRWDAPHGPRPRSRRRRLARDAPRESGAETPPEPSPARGGRLGPWAPAPFCHPAPRCFPSSQRSQLKRESQSDCCAPRPRRQEQTSDDVFINISPALSIHRRAPRLRNASATAGPSAEQLKDTGLAQKL